MPDHYHSEFRGLTAHQDFQVMKAWELNAQEILVQEIVPLAPFVPLMRDASEGAIREAARLLRQQPEGERAGIRVRCWCPSWASPTPAWQWPWWGLAGLAVLV